MKIIETLGTLFMLVVVVTLYALYFHNRHVHPIGDLIGDIKPGTECSQVVSAFTEYTAKHGQSRFAEISLEQQEEGEQPRSQYDKATYKLRLSDKGLFNNPVLTVYCDSRERVVEYSLDIQ